MIEARLPASSEQYEVWLATQREPESGRFNIPLDIEFTPGVDVAALRAAVQDVVDHHPAVRSTFDTDNGALERVVHQHVSVPFVDRRSERPYSPDEALRWAEQIALRPFDLTSAPLMRADLKHHPDGALLVLSVHHIISDGWSQQLLLKDLITAYTARAEGREPAFAPAASQEADTAAESDTAELDAYWSELLAGDVPSLAPIVDLNRESDQPGVPGWVIQDLPAEVLGSIRDLARTEAASPAVVVLGAWLTLLHAWADSVDGTSGMLFASRHGDAADAEVDLKARILPVRSHVPADRPFRDLLGALRDQTLDSFEHSAVTSQHLRRIRTAQSGGPLIDHCLFMHFPAGEGEWQAGPSTLRLVEHDSPYAKNDFALCAIEGRQSMRLRVDYDTSMYRRESAAVFLEQITELLRLAVTDPTRSCGELVTACDRFTPYDAGYAPIELVPLHHTVLRRAAERPDAIAVRHHDDSLTYAELVARAGSIAHWLRAQGVDNGDTIALLLPQGVTSVVFWLASLMAGGAYLPLDPVYPDVQLQLVLDTAAPTLVVVAPEFARRITVTTCPVFTTEQALYGAFRYPMQAPDTDVSIDQPYTVLYTSGSTGTPKGVRLPHSGAARMFQRPDFISIHETDVFSQLGALNFDIASYEVWGALTHGAELVIIDKDIVLSPRELREAFRRHAITRFTACNAHLNLLTEEVPDVFQQLRGVIVGGEIISVPHIRKLLRWAEPGTVLHVYGPTENSFISTWLPITEVADNARTIPIGFPVPDTDVYVVADIDTMRLAARGVPGEVLVGGAGVGHGYLNNPQETDKRFLPDPFSGRTAARIYRTGDRARWTPEGLLEFVGRHDNQVKIRGHRIELGEVESALVAHAAVRTAFVRIVLNDRGEKDIVAYAVMNRPGAVSEVLNHLRGVIPAFSVPRHLVELERMPISPNGKVDWRKLPVPGTTAAAVTAPVTAPSPAAVSTPAAVADTVLPSSSLAGVSRPVADVSVLDRVRAAWVAVLAHEDFGVDDNFFDVGGHSLRLVHLESELKSRLGTSPSVGELLRHTTVRAQAATLGGSAAALPSSVQTPVQTPVTAPSPAAVSAPAAVSTPAAVADTVLPSSSLAGVSRPVADVSVLDRVRAAWVAVLAHEDFGVDDNFFDVGGHSLRLVHLESELKSRLGTSPSVGELLRHTTVRAQAATLGGSAAALPSSVQTPVQTPVEVPAASTAPAAPASSAPRRGSRHVVGLSARSEHALQVARQRLASFIDENPGLVLADLATTLDRGRERMEYRWAVVADGLADFVGTVRGSSGDFATAEPSVVTGRYDLRAPRRTVFVFDDYRHFAAPVLAAYASTDAVAVWVAAAERILDAELAVPLQEHLGSARNGTPELDAVTAFVVQYALAERLAECGVLPDVLTGRGLGVLVAMAAGGRVSFPDALRLARLTGAGQAQPLGEALAATSFAASRVALTGAAAGNDARRLVDVLLDGAAPAGLSDDVLGREKGLIVEFGTASGTIASEASDGPVVTVAVISSESDSDPTLLHALSRLWCFAKDVSVTTDGEGRRVHLPGHPLERDGSYERL